MKMMNIFEMFDNNKEIAAFAEQSKKQQEGSAKANKEKTLKSNKDATDKIKAIKKKQEEDKYKDVTKQAKNFTKLIVKVWGVEKLRIEDPEEIKNINFKDLSYKLVNEFGFEEFGANVNWHITASQDKLTGYLIPVPPFKSKG